MRTVFAMQFEVQPSEGQAPEQCFEELCNLLQLWVSEKYSNVWKVQVGINGDGSVLEPIGHHRLSFKRQNGSSVSLADLEWHHPHDTDGSVDWVTLCTFAIADAKVQVLMTLGIASVDFVLRPTGFAVGRPRVLDTILETHKGFVEGQPLTVEPLELTTSTVER